MNDPITFVAYLLGILALFGVLGILGDYVLPCITKKLLEWVNKRNCPDCGDQHDMSKCAGMCGCCDSIRSADA